MKDLLVLIMGNYEFIKLFLEIVFRLLPIIFKNKARKKTRIMLDICIKHIIKIKLDIKIELK